MVKVAVLVSGGGTNLQAILDAAAARALPHAQIALVVSSRPGVAALGRAAKADVPAQVVCRKEYPDSASFDAALLEVLRAHDIRVCLLYTSGSGLCCQRFVQRHYPASLLPWEAPAYRRGHN